jgi:exodeoxyribonuclease III
MLIATLNVNGLRAAEKRGFREWVARAAPDVLCLQEVRADREVFPPGLYEPDGFSAVWHPAQQKGYSGTGVWSRSQAPHTVGVGHARGDAEGRVVGVHLGGLDVWSMYLPSGSSGPERQAWKFEMMAHVMPWFEARLRSGVPTLVCGDLNIAHTAMDIKNAKSNAKNSGFLPEERQWLDQLVAMGWRDAYRACNPTGQDYSWWSQRGAAYAKDVGWRIDHVWASPGVTLKRAWIERDARLSDHAPVLVEIG